NLDLSAGDVVLIAINQCPECPRGSGKAAGEYARLQNCCMRFPVRTDQVIGHDALDAGEPQQGFGILRSVFIPEAPEVFEGRISLAVEKGVLQAVGLVARE